MCVSFFSFRTVRGSCRQHTSLSCGCVWVCVRACVCSQCVVCVHLKSKNAAEAGAVAVVLGVGASGFSFFYFLLLCHVGGDELCCLCCGSFKWMCLPPHISSLCPQHRPEPPLFFFRIKRTGCVAGVASCSLSTKRFFFSGPVFLLCLFRSLTVLLFA